jgi:hypothetical protein
VFQEQSRHNHVPQVPLQLQQVQQSQSPLGQPLHKLLNNKKAPEQSGAFCIKHFFFYTF